MAGRTPVPDLSRYSKFTSATASNSSSYGSFANPPTEDIAGVYVGSAGTVTAVGSDGVAATFLNVQAGTILPISPKQITAGSGLVLLYW